MTRSIQLVVGVSSVGKSRFIARVQPQGNVDAEATVLLAHELTAERILELSSEHPYVVHYNLFRPFENRLSNVDRKFTSDPVLIRLLQLSDKIDCKFLVCRRAPLAKRILLREFVEPELRAGGSQYPSEQIFELLNGIELSRFYRQWFAFLKEHGIRYEVIETESGNYNKFENDDEALHWIGTDHHVVYSETEIEYIRKKYRFEYQSIPLPDSSCTAGDNRSKTLALVEDYFEGRSVLDIGCAYGYFCFEAERRNATAITGTELKRHRLTGANILKEVFNSKCEFLFRDVFEEPLAETFDVVLLLNVVHHLKEPVRALRKAAGMANHLLVIEFPTILDEKFQRTLVSGLVDRKTQEIPLIGVSMLSTQDQTFLFNEAAIERILLDHEQLCSRIDFLPSPMAKSRRLALCWK